MRGASRSLASTNQVAARGFLSENRLYYAHDPVPNMRVKKRIGDVAQGFASELDRLIR